MFSTRADLKHPARSQMYAAPFSRDPVDSVFLYGLELRSGVKFPSNFQAPGFVRAGEVMVQEPLHFQFLSVPYAIVEPAASNRWQRLKEIFGVPGFVYHENGSGLMISNSLPTDFRRLYLLQEVLDEAIRQEMVFDSKSGQVLAQKGRTTFATERAITLAGRDLNSKRYAAYLNCREDYFRALTGLKLIADEKRADFINSLQAVQRAKRVSGL